MGAAITVMLKYVLQHVGRYCDDDDYKPCYARPWDYSGGRLSQIGRDSYRANLKRLSVYDFVTKELLYPIMNTRVKTFQASQKYFQSDIDYLLYKFPEWSEDRIYDLHDLFQVFETHEDGIIDLEEMCMTLDNLGDSTQRSDRMEVLASADDDETGSIDFEEFLSAIYELEIILAEKNSHSLKQTFARIEGDVVFLRCMSTCQLVRAGFA